MSNGIYSLFEDRWIKFPEPIEVNVINRDQLMNGLHALPQEFLATVDQNSAYEAPAYIEEAEGRIDLLD